MWLSERLNYSCALIPQWMAPFVLMGGSPQSFTSLRLIMVLMVGSINSLSCASSSIATSFFSFRPGLDLWSSSADVCLKQTGPVACWSVMMQRGEKYLRIEWYSFLVQFSFLFPLCPSGLCITALHPSTCPMLSFALFKRKRIPALHNPVI